MLPKKSTKRTICDYPTCLRRAGNRHGAVNSPHSMQDGKPGIGSKPIPGLPDKKVKTEGFITFKASPHKSEDAIAPLNLSSV